MTTTSSYHCPAPCCRALLETGADGLRCPNGHAFPFATGTRVPVFASASDGTNEYAQKDAAAIHDNALRWVFATFRTSEEELRQNLVRRLRLASGEKVLVTGAGAGNDLPYLIRELGGKGEIHAQDIAQEMLLAGVERHSSAAAAAGVVLNFSVGDATALPLADGYFDAAYHFGGINLFPDIQKGIAEMNRVVRPGGRIVIGDEGLAPWLVNTEIGRMLICNNALYACEPPLHLLPDTARSVRLSWELRNTFYVIEFTVSREPLPIDIDVPHVGTRGGSVRTRYYGQIEGIDPALKDQLYAEAKRRGVSKVALIESLLRQGMPED